MSTAHLPSPPDAPSKELTARQVRTTKDGGEEEFDDDDDVTVVVLDASRYPFNSSSFLAASDGTAAGGVFIDDDESRRNAQLIMIQQQQNQARRNGMVHELRLVQRTSFRLFVAIIFVPILLLAIALAAVLSNDVDCSALSPTASDSLMATTTIGNQTTNAVSGGRIVTDDGALVSCWNEPRTFRNAFTTRCICDSVLVSS